MSNICFSGCDNSSKNKNADLTNPNVFVDIDDNKVVDHVYDEIKLKDGKGN